VFLTVRRATQDIYYFSSPGGYEVDFYLPEARQLIQVTQNLNNAATREREIRALQDAVQVLKPKGALILTDANGKDFEIAGVPVSIRSAAEWILSS
jgi:predicted AAA+ superfamily ATPase